MTDDTRVQQLLEELLVSEATPELVCASCPELLPVVRNRWQQMCRLRGDLDALFPAPTESPPLPSDEIPLPQLPGYEVEALLGRGGMGIVFRARHVRLKRSVAVKMLLGGPYAGPRERGRFQREAEAVAALRHPNVVQIYDVGDADGRPYFTMEYMEGGSLAQKLAGTPQPVYQAAQLVQTLAEVVHVAHQSGIVHRDLKPANIFLAADGTPKIGDFGIARRPDDGARLTQTGLLVGTPSYMAPEQGQGSRDAMGPAVDVYALGAILYELLTGRPPFQGETGAATIFQVITQDPVPPSRLNFKVPRDLETICLKCLQKAPQHRYAGAAALADDLRRFGEGRPIQARPLGWGARFGRWCRRNPTAAALVAMALVFVGLASGGGVWLVQQRAERQAEAIRHDRELRTEVATAVAQAVSLRQGFHFHEAAVLLDQVRRRLELAGPEDLRRQVQQRQAELQLAARLDTIRIEATRPVSGRLDPAGAERLYAAAFAQAGLGRESDDSDGVAARVRESAVSTEIVAALDDWAGITRDPQWRRWLLAVARKADPDPARDRLRRPELWHDSARLTQLAQELRVAELSPQLAVALGRVARGSGGDAVALLTAAQARFPQDFWLNLELGETMHQAHRLDEALGYLRTAVALRPQASVAHCGLGGILLEMGRQEEAIDHYQQAVRIDPGYTVAHFWFGYTLCELGRLEEAIDHFRQVIQLDPRKADIHDFLATALCDLGRLDEAIDHCRQAVRLDPGVAQFHYHLATALNDKGRFKEAMDHYRQAVRLDRNHVVDHHDLSISLYMAARAAARASAGPDAEKTKSGELERARLRQRALVRLRANLELRSRLRNDVKVLGGSLVTWQTDPALASVRDPAALAKLPEGEREQWQKLWADVAAQLAADPLELGCGYSARREWDRAAESYARAMTYIPKDDGHFWFEYAALLLLSGDRPGYTRACAHLLEGYGKVHGPRAYHVARACTLAPDAVAKVSLAGRLAESELKGTAGQFWSLTEQGALAYRSGQYQRAVPLFEQSLRADSRPGRAVLNWLWLALAHQRLGKTEEARRWLTRAQEWLDRYPDGMPARADAELGLHFHNWLEAHVLRREAEALLLPH
jgi:serine/threonine-protein kinase